MKIAVKYEVAIADGDGNHVADAQAQLNVTNVQQLVETIVSTIVNVMKCVDTCDAPVKSEFEAALAKAMAQTEVN